MKTRFAPSPTGFLHIGGLRTALFAYLFAKKNDGDFLLRVEDTDRDRFVEGGMENILNSLEWAGIVPDEGVKFDEDKKIIQAGKNGPYIQSQRLDIYEAKINDLIENDHAYHCFCTKERLDLLRKEQEENKQATGYDGKCRNLTAEEVKNRMENSDKSVIRMKMPESGTTKFNDLVRGDVEFENKLIDDQVLIKSDGFPTYHFAVVVDDYLMGITHVIRGEEWISSTPKHIQLYKMFGWDAPEFAHLPLLVNEKKQKLSKRHGDVSAVDFKEKGYLVEAIVNFVAFLGWNPGTEREIFSLEDLEKEFDLSKVSKGAAVFNRDKLDWYNKEYLKNLSVDEVTKRALTFLKNSGLLDNFDIEGDFERLKKIIELERSRVNNLSELPEVLGFIFSENLSYDPEILVWKKGSREEAGDVFGKLLEFLNNIEEGDWNRENLEEKIKVWIEENNFGTGNVLWPMRVALSGQKNSPGPFEIADVLGKKHCLERLKNAKNVIIG